MAIELISKIKPKNNGTFPMVDAEDVMMPDGSRLSDTEMGKPGEPGKDGKDGADGKDGYTPVKGTDYYTDADKAEFQTYLRTMFGENIVPLTQAEYDALVSAGTVDPNKYYMIVGDGE